jgi:hypothetical protein
MGQSQGGKTSMKPLGVRILAVLIAAYGAFLVADMLYALAHPPMVRGWSSNPADDLGVAEGIAIFTPLHIALAGLLAYGLWSLQDWARRGVIFFAGLGLLRLTIKTHGAAGRSAVADRLSAMLHSSSLYAEGAYALCLVGVMLYLSLSTVSELFRSSATDA